ncbi:MAG: hypothetical protein ACK56I_08180, partial [bacterium]
SFVSTPVTLPEQLPSDWRFTLPEQLPSIRRNKQLLEQHPSVIQTCCPYKVPEQLPAVLVLFSRCC